MVPQSGAQARGRSRLEAVNRLAALLNGPVECLAGEGDDRVHGRSIAASFCTVCKVDILWGPLASGFERELSRCSAHPGTEGEQNAIACGATDAECMAEYQDPHDSAYLDYWALWTPGTPEHAAFVAGWRAAWWSREREDGTPWREPRHPR